MYFHRTNLFRCQHTPKGHRQALPYLPKLGRLPLGADPAVATPCSQRPTVPRSAVLKKGPLEGPAATFVVAPSLPLRRALRAYLLLLRTISRGIPPARRAAVTDDTHHMSGRASTRWNTSISLFLSPCPILPGAVKLYCCSWRAGDRRRCLVQCLSTFLRGAAADKPGSKSALVKL